MKGVNKLFLILAVFLLITPIVFSEEIKTYVNDYANILNQEQENEIASIAKQIKDSGEAEYAVVIINSLEGQSIEAYSLELAQGNLGDTEKNNGLLLLVALEDRKYRFEVGRGLEAILNDAKVGRIGRNYLVPNFQDENYANGILEASLAVRSILLGDVESEYYAAVNEVSYEQYEPLFTFAFFLIFFIGLPLLANIFRKKKSDNRYFNAAMGAVILFGGRRGGGHSGGFGGFGGGGFGGGGASGGW